MAKKTTDYLGEIAATREKIRAAQERAELTRDALPGAEAEIEQATRQIEKKAATGLGHAKYWGRNIGQPGATVSLFGEMFFMGLPAAGGGNDAAAATTGRISMSAAENIFLALHKTEILKIATEAIRARYANFDGLILDPIEKRAAIKEAEDAVFELEQVEESIIEQAEDAGLTIQRRADASPEAILGIERGASVPHDWRSAKYDRLLDERDAHHARMDAARARLSTAQGELVFLEQNLRDQYRSDPAEADLKAAREAVAYRRKILADLMQQAHEVIAVASSLENYIENHRLAKPCPRMEESVGQAPYPRNAPVGMVFPGRNGGVK